MLAVLPMFGNGRPSTNGMLGSDLMANDAVLRPFEGPLPFPRMLSSWKVSDLFFLHRTDDSMNDWRGISRYASVGPGSLVWKSFCCEGNGHGFYFTYINCFRLKLKRQQKRSVRC